MGLSVLRLAGGAVHGSESNAGAAVARRSSANPRAACARLLHSIRERERDRHQSERCGYPFGAADPASLPSPRRRGVIIAEASPLSFSLHFTQILTALHIETISSTECVT